MQSTALALQKVEPLIKRDGSARPLNHLVGEVCLVGGRIKEIIRGENGELERLLLKNVDVRPNIRNAPLLSIKPIRVEHIWIMPPSDPGDLELLASIYFVGYCYKYTRSNGTQDYSIDATVGEDLDIFVEVIADHLNPSKANREIYLTFDTAVKMLEKAPPELRYLRSETISAEQIEEGFRSARKMFQQWVEVEDKTLATATMNGKPQGLHQIPARCRKRNQRAMATGF